MKNAVCLALLAWGASAQIAAPEPSLYDRVTQRLAHDPVLAREIGKPAKEMQALAWLVGTWDVVAEVEAGTKPKAPEHGTSTVSRALGGVWLEIRDSYPSGTQDIGYLGFNPATRRWTSLALDSLGNAVTTSGTQWKNDMLVLGGDATIVGVHTTLRQTLRQLNADAYVVTNEERGADGRWRLLDTYRYTRRR